MEKKILINEGYAKGLLLAPAHNKLSHIDETLKEIRSVIGIMTELEINSFFEHFKELNVQKPNNWDFL